MAAAPWSCMTCMKTNGCTTETLVAGTECVQLPMHYDDNQNTYVMYGLFCSSVCRRIFATTCLTPPQLAETRPLIAQLERTPSLLLGRVVLADREAAPYAFGCAHRHVHNADWTPLRESMLDDATLRTVLLHAPTLAASALFGRPPPPPAAAAATTTTTTEAEAETATPTARFIFGVMAAPHAPGDDHDARQRFHGSELLRAASAEPTRRIGDPSLLDAVLRNARLFPDGHLLLIYRLLVAQRLLEIVKRRDATRLWQDVQSLAAAPAASSAAPRLSAAALALLDDAAESFRPPAARSEFDTNCGIVVQAQRQRITPCAVNAALRRLRQVLVQKDGIFKLVMAQRTVPSYVIEVLPPELQVGNAKRARDDPAAAATAQQQKQQQQESQDQSSAPPPPPLTTVMVLLQDIVVILLGGSVPQDMYGPVQDTELDLGDDENDDDDADDDDGDANDDENEHDGDAKDAKDKDQQAQSDGHRRRRRRRRRRRGGGGGSATVAAAAAALGKPKASGTLYMRIISDTLTDVMGMDAAAALALELPAEKTKIEP